MDAIVRDLRVKLKKAVTRNETMFKIAENREAELARLRFRVQELESRLEREGTKKRPPSLSDNQAAMIRILFAKRSGDEGVMNTKRALAVEFKVSVTTINAVIGQTGRYSPNREKG